MAAANQSSILKKCTRIMDILTNARRPLYFAEIVERSGFVKSSTHRILSVLQSEGLVEHDFSNKNYITGPRLTEWARAAWRRNDLQQIAGPELESLCENTGQNVALSIRDHDSVLYLRTVDAIPVRYASRTGEHAPLHCTAVGKVFLAFMPEPQCKELLAGLQYERLTENSIQTADALAADLKNVRKQGFGLANREEALQLIGVAAPIWNGQGAVTAGISLWTLAERKTVEEMIAYTPLLMDAAKRVSYRLGYGGG